MNTTKPPKNREFLGLSVRSGEAYWDIYFWATKKHGVQIPCFVDTELFDMGDIYVWAELPEIPIIDELEIIKI